MNELISEIVNCQFEKINNKLDALDKQLNILTLNILSIENKINNIETNLQNIQHIQHIK